jgi:hypothetical protein
MGSNLCVLKTVNRVQSDLFIILSFALDKWGVPRS